MMILDGKTLASGLNSELAIKLERYKIKPTLAVILIGEDKSSQVYVRNKEIACKAVGIKSMTYRLDAKISQNELLGLINELNNDESVDAILVQLPLPKHIDKNQVINAIEPSKDVDGFHPLNLGALLSGDESALLACTPKGIIRLLEHHKIALKGKNVCVINESIIVGRPMLAMLLNRKASVDVCHVHTKDLKAHTLRADVIISATGKSDLIDESFVNENSVLIDVGMALNGANGDISQSAKDAAFAYTPVPGGVGPMTVAMLLENTYLAAMRRINAR